MPTFQLVYGEEQTTVRYIEIEVEAETIMQAAERAVKAAEEGKYDAQLEQSSKETKETRNEVAYHNAKGEYMVLLPWD
jgi:hypothetical protein